MRCLRGRQRTVARDNNFRAVLPCLSCDDDERSDPVMPAESAPPAQQAAAARRDGRSSAGTTYRLRLDALQPPIVACGKLPSRFCSRPTMRLYPRLIGQPYS